ncbi:MAG: cation-translocating P-type ATPase [Polaromonas sp.]|nr:cation-translocating P-type ATPase [Polaromonas sp.]
MHAAVFTSTSSGRVSSLSQAETHQDAGVDGLRIFDDVQEWSRFSQQPTQQGQPAGIASTVWESQVLVSGMHCAACSLMLEQALLATPGVQSARVSAASQRASVVWSSAVTRPSEWLCAPRVLGYTLSPALDTAASDQTRKDARLALWRWLVAGFCMMQVMMYAFPAYVTEPGEIAPDIEKLLRWASWVLTLPVLLFSCKPFFANALRDLRQRNVSMDLPVALGIVITFVISSAATFETAGWWSAEVYFDSLTMFVFFLLTGRWLEQRLRARTSGALDSLMQRLPDSVQRQLPNGEFEQVAVRRLKVGDLVRVLPGQAFPADGVIEGGNTFADEALLTGESRPVARPVGALVMAGSYNLSATVQVRVQQLGQATRYAGIVALMQRAAVDKPRLAQLADRVARPFLWFVMLAALLAAAYWWNTDPARAVMAAVAVLVVTCPCALSLATPTAMLTSAGVLAKQGVLVRRLQALEALADVDTVVFDKTGTLTEARMGLGHISTRDGVLAADALALAAGLARHSLHPVSRAFADGSAAANSFRLTEVAEHAGQGLQGVLADTCLGMASGPVRFGSASFCGVNGAMVGAVNNDTLQVFLADASGWLARFELDEVVRPDAVDAVKQLQLAGLEVHMLSGDRSVAARRVAERLGIQHVQGDCTPQSKLAHLQALQGRGRKVLMVGDGLNDGPVLARADVSVAVGQAVPLAQAQSDFIIPGGLLLMLASMPTQARRTLSIVRQNLAWAAAYNAVGVPLAIAGYLPAWLAGLGMALSSLFVLLNAARLARAPEGN